MLAGLQAARNEAIRRNAAVRFSLVALADSAVLDSSCALSGGGVSWVVSVRDPAGNCQQVPVNVADNTAYALAVADLTNPLIVEAHAGGQGGRNVVAAARVADGSAAADTVVFNGLGRVENASAIGMIDVRNETHGNDYRRFRIEISPGGALRMCDYDVTPTTDSRYCPTRGISPP
jgi:type IV fimbrial biogenesis protein FimT